MKFATALLLAFGLLLAQAQPVPATMRIPSAGMPCGQARNPCQEHDAPGDPPPCPMCLSCGLSCHLAVLTAPAIPGALLVATDWLAWRDEIGRQWREPPPLPPPRLASGS